MSQHTLIIAALSSGFFVACTSTPKVPTSNAFCTRELRVDFTPADTSVLVGQTFQASVGLASCGGAELLTDVITWRSDDPAVATVGLSTGQVVARGAGRTRIAATGERYGAVGAIEVLVGP